MDAMTTTEPTAGFTIADLAAMPGTGCGHELIDGTLFVTRPGGSLTRAERESWPDDGRRVELAGGILVVSPSPSLEHQTAVGRLFRALDSSRPDGMQAVTAPFDVVPGEDIVLIPDLLVARTAHLARRELVVPPLLTVEVLSPSTRHYDLSMKRAIYEESGVASYWVIDPLEPSLIAWDLVDGAYVEVGHVRGDESWTSELPFPVTVTPARLVADR